MSDLEFEITQAGPSKDVPTLVITKVHPHLEMVSMVNLTSPPEVIAKGLRTMADWLENKGVFSE